MALPALTQCRRSGNEYFAMSSKTIDLYSVGGAHSVVIGCVDRTERTD